MPDFRKFFVGTSKVWLHNYIYVEDNVETPIFASRAVYNYERYGTPGEANTYSNLSKEDAQNSLDQMKDEFKKWESLDEGPSDLLKGQKGAVKIAGPQPHEYVQAEFSSNGDQRKLEVEDRTPSHHYGASFYTQINFNQQTAEQLSVTGFENERELNTTLVHVDHRISSQGPISIGSGTTTVTLKDNAFSGYIASNNA